MRIAKRYAAAAARFADGVLLSGSNAYGANYAVTDRSDIDLLIVAGNTDKLGKIVRQYISEQLLNEKEQKRFRIFSKLHEEGKAKQFSTITRYKGVNVSLDLLTSASLRDIAHFRRMKQRMLGKACIRIIHEFRITPPRAAGYSLDSLDGKIHLIYHPTFITCKGSYVAETLVDGKAPGYCLGVMSFFLCISPQILWEKEEFFTKAINEFRARIAQMQGRRKPSYITRQERMLKSVLREIKRSLSGHQAP